jgi:hypothetical protein
MAFVQRIRTAATARPALRVGPARLVSLSPITLNVRVCEHARLLLDLIIRAGVKKDRVKVRFGRGIPLVEKRAHR